MIVVALVAGWFLGISPRLSEAVGTTADRLVVDAQNEAYEDQLADLKKRFESLTEAKADLAAVREAVPSGAHLPEFVRQINSIAEGRHVAVMSIAVKDAQPYVPVIPVAPAAPAENPPPAGDTAPTDGSTAPPAPAPAPADQDAATTAGIENAAEVTGLSSLVTAENFVAVTVDVKVMGDYAAVLGFIDGMHKGSRLATITAIKTTNEAGGVAAEITTMVYVLVNPAAQVPAPAG